jgi:hypothetical protein
MQILFHDDERKVNAHSSIDQFKDFFSVYTGGEWIPIEYDYIDYINCGKVVSHPVIVDTGDHIGYFYAVGECSTVEDEYPMFDYEEIVTKPLPEFQGEGEYEAYEKDDVIVNFDNAALGLRNVNRYRIGQDYLLADEFLPADDVE